MRAVWLAAILLLAGCVTSPATTDDAPAANATAPGGVGSGASNATAPASGMGERMARRSETFVLLADRTIGVVREGEKGPEEARLPEPASGTAFHQSFVTPPPLAPFATAPFGVGFETSEEFDLTLSFVATAPAATTLPSASGFPAVGAWFGTTERWALFLGAPDVPPTLEANKVYTVTMRVPLPKGGFFVRAGEQLAIHPYLNYQAADNSPISWVVGGAQPSGFTMPHTHFNLSAPVATMILDENGETGPNPSVSGEQNPQPVDFPVKVPADAVYVVLEASGAAKAGSRLDLDASFRSASGEVLAGGSGPHEREVVVLGPSALAQAGRDLIAHVTSSGASGATFHVTVTAYAPAA